MDQVRMGGEIQAGLIADLLQLLSSRSEVAGYLEVLSDGILGRTWFKKGRMVDAQWANITGEPAVRKILGVRNGRFRFVESDGIRPTTITRDATFVLLDAMRAIDECGPAPSAIPAAPEAQPLPTAQATPPVAIQTTTPPPARVKKRHRKQPTQSVAKTKAVRPVRTKRSPKRHSVQSRPFPYLLRQLGLAALLLVGFALSVVWYDSVRTSQSPVKAPLSAKTNLSAQPVLRSPSPVVDFSQQQWPYFSLSGLLAKGPQDGEGAAVINGEVISVGERVDGMILRGIGANGVTLEYQGDRQFKALGEQKEHPENRQRILKLGASALRSFSFVRNS